MDFQMEDWPCLASLWEMLKVLQIMPFPASYYSVKVLGFHKALVILMGTGLCLLFVNFRYRQLRNTGSKAILSWPQYNTSTVITKTLSTNSSLFGSAYYAFISMRDCTIRSLQLPWIHHCWQEMVLVFWQPPGSQKAPRLLVALLAQCQAQSSQSCTLKWGCSSWRRKTGIKPEVNKNWEGPQRCRVGWQYFKLSDFQTLTFPMHPACFKPLGIVLFPLCFCD